MDVDSIDACEDCTDAAETPSRASHDHSGALATLVVVLAGIVP